jgi:hypothetical protein
LIVRLPFGERIGIQYAWLTLALIVVVLLVPVVMLKVYGPSWRSLPSQNPPKQTEDRR